jgi:integrase
MPDEKRARGEGTVRDRGPEAPPGSRFEARMPGRGGKSFYGPTPEIAVDRREKYKERLRGGIPENVTKATLAEYMPFWLENTVRVNVRPATYQHHKRISRNHILPTLGNQKMIDLTADHVQTLHAAKFDAGYALSTRRHIHTTLKAALDQAVRFGHLPFNAAASVRVSTGEGGPSEADADYEDLPDPDMQVWTGEDVRKFLRKAAELGGRYHALYVLALTTGMRQGEMLGLPWKHVDLRDGVLNVLQTLVRDEGRWRFPRPKTERSRRTLELRGEAVDALRQHRERQFAERGFYKELWMDRGLVFPTTVGTPTARQNLARRSFKPLIRAAKVPNIRFHDMRHTFATLMLKNRSDLNTVSRMLGHSSVKITLDVYGHVVPGMQKEALKSLDELF